MDKYREIAELLKGFQRIGNVFFPATVESVEGNTCTINVDGLSVSDVRLKATDENTNDTVLMMPAVGANVLVGSYSDDFSNLFIIRSDSFCELYLNVGKISFKLNKDGVVLNDGKNKGLVKINEMVGWMQKVYSDLQSIKMLLSTSLTKAQGAPMAIKFNPSTPNPKIGDFENDKVAH